uniref:Uncharacterized protein n=1 Tax=Brassica oleracea TaxID=3712 RepID=A0A3P6FPK3_BRAOL|nr:unnamed protein product [Brassica oleracea]
METHNQGRQFLCPSIFLDSSVPRSFSTSIPLYRSN